MEFPVYYNNNNYQVKIEADGTKTRTTFDEKFEPKFPETIDVNISNYCKNNCEFCYLDASREGLHGKLDARFFDLLKPFQEIAINYANHPGLKFFLEKMQSKNVIVNTTINQNDLIKDHKTILLYLQLGLIRGLGISVQKYDKPLVKVLKSLANYETRIVFHTIAGITTEETFKDLKGKKILVLGFKTKGRALNLEKPIVEINLLKEKLPDYLKGYFELISFDNLALEQLAVKTMVSKEDWELYYMGAEGNYSMYYDAVTDKVFKSSLETEGYKTGYLNLELLFKLVQ